VTKAKVRGRAGHPELARPEFARVCWHRGRYHYQSGRDRPMIALGTDVRSACFMSKLAIAKQADRAWRTHVRCKMRDLPA
jgi:hypothetical protein